MGTMEGRIATRWIVVAFLNNKLVAVKENVEGVANLPKSTSDRRSKPECQN